MLLLIVAVHTIHSECFHGVAMAISFEKELSEDIVEIAAWIWVGQADVIHALLGFQSASYNKLSSSTT